MTDVMVEVRDLSKRFKLYDNPWHRALEWVMLGRVVRHREFWALRDVAFEVRRGECLGIIGVNGAGKSTLLKILSRTLHPTHGTFQVNGRLVSLLELGTGFHPDLTGRQNLYQSAALLGFPEAYVRGRLAEILDFANIGEFIDQPVKRYSSGMFVRLAFSLFAHLEPDVYIVDEALAVGDVFFQQKCFRRFAELKRGGCTILFVTHDMAAVTHLCDRALLLSGGKVAAQGDPVSVVHDYFALSGQTFVPSAALTVPPVPASGPERLSVPDAVGAALSAPLPGQRGGTGNGTTEIGGFAITDLHGRMSWTVPSGGRLRFWYLITACRPCDDLNVGIHFYDRRGILVFAIGTANLGLALPRLEPGERVVCAIDVTLAVQPGEYTLLPQTGGLTGGSPEPGLLHDRLEKLPPVVVTPSRPDGRTPFYGLVGLAADAAWAQRPEDRDALVPQRRAEASVGGYFWPAGQEAQDERTTFPASESDLRAAEFYREPWYYTFELLPGVFTPGAGHLNLGLTRALLARCAVEGRTCLDIGTMEAAVPVLLSRRGAEKIVAVDVAPSDDKIATVKHYTGAEFDYHSGLVHGETVEFLRARRQVNFDLVVLSGVLYHCFGPLHTLAMARSLVRTGGLMLIETFAAIDEQYAMFFNARGMFTSDPSTYLLPSVPLLDYLFRYFKLQPIDCVHGGRVMVGEHQCTRIATVCRAVQAVVAEPSDQWIDAATGIVDYLTLCDWRLIENREHDPVGYDVASRTAKMRADIGACDLLATVLSEPPMNLTADGAVIHLDDRV